MSRTVAGETQLNPAERKKARQRSGVLASEIMDKVVAEHTLYFTERAASNKAMVEFRP